MWPTPTKREYFPPRLPETMEKTKRNPLTNTLGDAVQYREGKSYKETGQLNPMWVEWLMGYPQGWTDLNHSETASSRTSRTTLDNQLSKPTMWRTPTQQDSRIGPNNKGGYQHRRKRGSTALADQVLFEHKSNEDNDTVQTEGTSKDYT